MPRRCKDSFMHRFRFMVLLGCFISGQAARLHAIDLTGQLGLVEQGDDRSGGIAGVTLSLPKTAHIGLFTFGYKQSPVRQTSILTHLSYPFSIDGYDILSAQIGISLLHTVTSISRAQDDISEGASNVGGHFGLEAKIPLTKSLHMKGGWHSFVYPAGLTSILLVSARRQALTLGVGASL